MNTLQKCIDELKKDQPDIRYILGMLETYMELSHPGVLVKGIETSTSLRQEHIPADESKDPIAIAYETGRTGKVS